VPDKHRGETIKAYVRRCEGVVLTAGELRSFLRDKLAPFEQPKAIEFRDQLPQTWLGKPSRRALVAEEMRRLNAEALGATAAVPAAAADPVRAA
jgi:long-chain acyl-CoA synthetase